MNGVIYILTNPSFPEYVKIGYADDIEARLSQLNRSECIPFAFRVYATYEVSNRLVDLKLHDLIDRLNPSLRSIDTFKGKQRKREFYAMSPEEAYALLEAIAEIHGYTDRLKLWKMNEKEAQAQEAAREISEERRERLAPFTFSKCRIAPGEVLTFCSDPSITCVVLDDKNVEFQGKKYSLSALATELSGSKWGVAGPRYFKYKGEWLNDIRRRVAGE